MRSDEVETADGVVLIDRDVLFLPEHVRLNRVNEQWESYWQDVIKQAA